MARLTRKERRRRPCGEPKGPRPAPEVMAEPEGGPFARPREVDRLTAALGAGRDVYSLMPAYRDLPEEFKRPGGSPFLAIQAEWFFRGLEAGLLVARPGIDRRKALAHLSAIQRSFEPPHEHKAAGVAYLMSLWFEPPAET